MKNDSTKLSRSFGSGCVMGIIGMFMGGYLGFRFSDGWDVRKRNISGFSNTFYAIFDGAFSLVLGAFIGLIIGLILNYIIIRTNNKSRSGG